ncbi:MAG: hypothetical protein ACJAVK_003707, partial [Akkermansiaceae bacterium]
MPWRFSKNQGAFAAKEKWGLSPKTCDYFHQRLITRHSMPGIFVYAGVVNAVEESSHVRFYDVVVFPDG